MTNSRSDFLATLKYKTTEQGGRQTAALPGYRPHIKFPFDTVLTSGQQIFLDKQIVYPGEVVKADIMILAVEHFQHCLYEGLEFEFGEGDIIIGTGVVTKVVNEKLRANSNDR